jgi:hypothetical protein
MALESVGYDSTNHNHHGIASSGNEEAELGEDFLLTCLLPRLTQLHVLQSLQEQCMYRFH